MMKSLIQPEQRCSGIKKDQATSPTHWWHSSLSELEIDVNGLKKWQLNSGGGVILCIQKGGFVGEINNLQVVHYLRKAPTIVLFNQFNETISSYSFLYRGHFNSLPYQPQHWEDIPP